MLIDHFVIFCRLFRVEYRLAFRQEFPLCVKVINKEVGEYGEDIYMEADIVNDPEEEIILKYVSI
jgi:hypothetical protein